VRLNITTKAALAGGEVKRGKLIVLEGIDGSGTTTQAKRLYRRLLQKGFKASLTSEPSRGPAGKLIREYLSGEAKFLDRKLGANALALLFAADRLDHLSSRINPLLQEGKMVVSDRYVLSSLAYQSLECDLDWVLKINRNARPADLTLLLDLPAGTALKRVSRRGKSRELFEKLAIQKKVRANYLKLAGKLGRAHGIVVINGEKSSAEIQEEILKTVLTFLEGSGKS